MFPDRQIGRWNGRSLFVRHAFRDRVGVGGGNAQVLSVAAVEGAAQELGAAAQVVPARQTGGTLLAGQPGVDHNPVALFQP